MEGPSTFFISDNYSTIGARIREFGGSNVRCAPFFQQFTDFKVSCLCLTLFVTFIAWQRAQHRLFVIYLLSYLFVYYLFIYLYYCTGLYTWIYQNGLQRCCG